MVFLFFLFIVFVIYSVYKWIKSKEKEKQAEEQNDWQQLHYIKTKEFYENDIEVKVFSLFVIIIFMCLIVFAYIKDIKPIFEYISRAIETELDARE